jgi:hypothetical protein
LSYANSYLVSYTRKEFYVELRLDGPREKGIVGVFFMRPETAKGLKEALGLMISGYEKEYGQVESPILEETGEKTGAEPPKSTWKGIA